MSIAPSSTKLEHRLTRPSVRKAQPEDSRTIARLHREIISWALLSHLGEDATTAFYRAVTRSPAAFCILAEVEGEAQGFAAGICDWRIFRRRLIREMWWPLLRALPELFWSGRWRRLAETARYTQSRHEGVRAEYVSFGVREEAKGRLWIGAAVLYAGLEEFRRRGIRKIRGVVWDQNERAVRFFEAMGFRFDSEYEIHPGFVSRYFIVDISRGLGGDISRGGPGAEPSSEQGGIRGARDG